MEWMTQLSQYMAYPFVRYALIVGVLIALCSSLIGVTLVLKRFSFIGDGLSHTAFGAIAIASVMNLTNEMLFVLPVTILCAVLLLRTSQNAKIKGDAAVAMISVGSLAIGYLLMNLFSTSTNLSGDVCTTLFGSTSILTLTITEVWLCAGLSMAVVLIFVGVAIFALLTSKKAEQNMVWVGLSKETAHQLGTPISSLMAWVELLKVQYPNDTLIPSMSEDVERLQMIANRFSKIGSAPELKAVDLRMLLEHVVEYMRHRTSDKVRIVMRMPDNLPKVRLSVELFEWVIENLCKNAVDAMNGVGCLTISVEEGVKYWYIDVSDTGKGIDKRHFEDVFAPGYTTKKRGWGLGLSLARRIVMEYHSGRIFVKQSELNRGTTFRIELKK